MIIVVILVTSGLTAPLYCGDVKDDQTKVAPAIEFVRKDEVAARATLEMKPDVLTPELHRRSFLMSFPKQVKLSSEKPGRISKEPVYSGSPRYGSVSAGTGPGSVFDLVFDEAANAAKLYLDANHDGDLTDDPPIAWDSVIDRAVCRGTTA